jgi:hypothetical protein
MLISKKGKRFYHERRANHFLIRGVCDDEVVVRIIEM